MAPSKNAAPGNTVVSEDPPYIAHRIQAWDAAVAAREAAKLSMNGMAEVKISVTLPSGDVKEAVKDVTTPMDIAMGISETLGRKALVALVNGEEWDMDRAFEKDSSLAICGYDTPEGKNTLWHSTAHMLGEALEYKYKGALCIGPPLEEGFYYDIHIPGDVKITSADFEDLNKRVNEIIKQKRKFERLELTKAEAKDMFSYNRFKVEIIDELDESATITAYRDGPFIDLCKGPHIPQSTRVKAMMCKSTGQAYWRAKEGNPSLQRVYGISFPDKKMMKEYKTFIAEAAKRDHRVIGVKQDLMMLHPYSPGCPFFLPHGQRIFNTLMEFMRKQYWKRGYDEVQTPNLFDFDLWHTSGHAAKYKDNMFQLKVEGRDFGLKPMNCPAHCLIFQERVRSYRELPMRIADFGVLHRNELSGTLGGLTRVRRFQQDDGHIFCRADQMMDEVEAYLDFFKYVYGVFGFNWELDLSTRPENYVGEIALWDKAEAVLARALEKFTGKKAGEKGGWDINEGDGAFYGPKIDIKVYDALRRRHQCATLQLDFQLPIRFNLQYQDPTAEKSEDEKIKEGFARPVLIHRAIYGSFERFFAILIEHFGGFWPFWLSPRQCIVVPVSEKYLDYAKSVRGELREDVFHVDIDTSDRTLGKKLAEARNNYYNTILVVGEAEQAEGKVNMRVRGDDKTEVKSVAEVAEMFKQWRADYK